MRSPCIATKSNACSPQREKAHAHQRSPITAIQKQKHPARLRPSGFQQRAPAPRLGRGPQCGLMHRLLEGAQGLELLPPSFIVSTPPRGVAGLSLPPSFIVSTPPRGVAGLFLWVRLLLSLLLLLASLAISHSPSPVSLPLGFINIYIALATGQVLV